LVGLYDAYLHMKFLSLRVTYLISFQSPASQSTSRMTMSFGRRGN
jgi:hypothetical protein